MLDAEGFARPIGPKAQTIPGFALGVALTAKEYRPVSTVGCRDQYQCRLWLGESTQVMKMTVKAEGVVRIAIAHLFRRCQQNGNPTALLGHFGCKTCPAVRADAAFGIGGVVHGSSSLRF